jgi:hypothetical protein
MRRSVVIALAGGILWLLVSAGAEAAGPKITSVVISGTEAHPVVTITGHRLGKRPLPNPAYHPLGHPPLCPPKPTLAPARYGFDYGTRLYIQDATQQPAWSAGRYRPSVNELDCIGIVLTKFTPSRVVFRLGAAYPTLPGSSTAFSLKEGDAFVVGVNGTRSSGKVHYRTKA